MSCVRKVHASSQTVLAFGRSSIQRAWKDNELFSMDCMSKFLEARPRRTLSTYLRTHSCRSSRKKNRVRSLRYYSKRTRNWHEQTRLLTFDRVRSSWDSNLLKRF